MNVYLDTEGRPMKLRPLRPAVAFSIVALLLLLLILPPEAVKIVVGMAGAALAVVTVAVMLFGRGEG
jgi:hypothetical protein